MEEIAYKLCPVCNKRISSMVIVNEMCHQCYNEGNNIKKFSGMNNMNLGDIPEELQGFTEIKEMLIAQVFMVMSVYRLRGRQYRYHGNVINFPQDIQEFTTRLPHKPSTLDILVMRHQSANDPTAFRDFNV
jgi:hypothetical protein